MLMTFIMIFVMYICCIFSAYNKVQKMNTSDLNQCLFLKSYCVILIYKCIFM